MKTIAALLALAVLSLPAGANPPAAPAGHAGGSPADMSKSTAPLNKQAKVLSVIDAKSFTYMEVQDGSKKFWIVSPAVAVKAGNSIHYADAAMQPKYHSASLKRDFTNIVFSTRVVVDK